MSAGRRLPVLVYHQFSATRRDKLTVASADFERQLAHLQSREYRSITFAELLARDCAPAADRRVLLTFDDGYESVAEIAVPLLQRYGFGATCFIPVGRIGAENAWDGGGAPLMSADTLRALPSDCIELALHSMLHESYREMSPLQIENDVRACCARLDALGLAYVPVVAYPYGRAARDEATLREWRHALQRGGARLACRLGNRLNSLPPSDPFMLTRTVVSGDEGMLRFRAKVALGRCKPF